MGGKIPPDEVEDSPSESDVVESNEGSRVESGAVVDDDCPGSGKDAVGLNRGLKFR